MSYESCFHSKQQQNSVPLRYETRQGDGLLVLLCVGQSVAPHQDQGRAANKVDAPHVRHYFEHEARHQQRMEERQWHASGLAIPCSEQLDTEKKRTSGLPTWPPKAVGELWV